MSEFNDQSFCQKRATGPCTQWIFVQGIASVDLICVVDQRRLFTRQKTPSGSHSSRLIEGEVVAPLSSPLATAAGRKHLDKLYFDTSTGSMSVNIIDVLEPI